MTTSNSAKPTTVFSRLRAEHASDLAAMEMVYPAAMRQGLEVIRERLRILETLPYPMSWISRREGRCLSYLLAYPAPTQLNIEPPHTVIYIDDLQVGDGHSNHLFPLLKLLAKDLHALGLSKLPIEGVTRRSSYRLLLGHEALIHGLGWELESQHSYWDESAEESLTWVRYTPIEDANFQPAASPREGMLMASSRRRLRQDLAALAGVLAHQVLHPMVGVPPRLAPPGSLPGYKKLGGG